MKNVAIIFVNYNGWKDTIDCLKTLENITYKNFKVFIVDNHSEDDSVERIKEYENNASYPMYVVESSENLGFAGGNNVGLEQAKKEHFDYYLFLNNDTLVTPTFLESLLEPFKTNKEVGATIGKIYYESDRKRIWYGGGVLNQSYMKPVHINFNVVETKHVSEQREVSFATGCCICCSDKCIEKIGNWSELFFLYEEDVDFSKRIVEQGFKIIYCSDSVIYHKVSASTGKMSQQSQIYQVRNRLMLIKTYLSGLGKYKAYIYTYLLFLNRIRKKEYNYNAVKMGIRAFKNGEYGKHGNK